MNILTSQTIDYLIWKTLKVPKLKVIYSSYIFNLDFLYPYFVFGPTTRIHTRSLHKLKHIRTLNHSIIWIPFAEEMILVKSATSISFPFSAMRGFVFHFSDGSIGFWKPCCLSCILGQNFKDYNHKRIIQELQTRSRLRFDLHSVQK